MLGWGMQQLFDQESFTYTYLLWDSASHEAVLVDPVLEMVERDLQLVNELGLKLKYILETHVHADHVTGAGVIRSRTGAQTGLSHHAGVQCADLALRHGQELFLGNEKLQVMETPGHTQTCLTYIWQGHLLTGDSLMIRGCGRTDFQQGSAEAMFHSIRDILFQFPDSTVIFPAHDYRGFNQSSVGAEKAFNPRIGLHKTKPEFLQIMADLKLAEPKKISQALPANLACGKLTGR